MNICKQLEFILTKKTQRLVVGRFYLKLDIYSMLDKAQFLMFSSLNCIRLFKSTISVQWCINGQTFYSHVFKDTGANVAILSVANIFSWVKEIEKIFYSHLVYTEDRSLDLIFFNVTWHLYNLVYHYTKQKNFLHTK